MKVCNKKISREAYLKWQNSRQKKEKKVLEKDFVE